MSPELKHLVAAVHDKDASLLPLRDKVKAAADLLRANYRELEAGETALWKLRVEAQRLFDRDTLPTVCPLPDIKAALHGFER